MFSCWAYTYVSLSVSKHYSEVHDIDIIECIVVYSLHFPVPDINSLVLLSGFPLFVCTLPSTQKSMKHQYI
jgi:hypothetical protein